MTEKKFKYDILIVEDSRLIAKVLEDWVLRLYGEGEKHIVICHDAESAVQNLELRKKESEQLPDIIILDLELPGQHGLEFLKTLKADSALRSIPVIVNSSSEKKEDILGAYKGGGLLFMKKGDDEKVFQTMIHQLRIQGILK